MPPHQTQPCGHRRAAAAAAGAALGRRGAAAVVSVAARGWRTLEDKSGTALHARRFQRGLGCEGGGGESGEWGEVRGFSGPAVGENFLRHSALSFLST